MDREEYTKLLEDINTDLDRENYNVDIKETLNILDVLYDFKPVSTRWYQVKCKAMMKNGQFSEVVNSFSDRISKEYDIEANAELWQQVIDAYKMTGQELEAERQSYMLSKLINTTKYMDIDTELKEVRKKFVEGDEAPEILLALEQFYYKSSNWLMAYCVYLYAAKLYPCLRSIDKENIYINLDNMGFWSEYLEESKMMIIIADQEETEDYDILAYILHDLGISIYMISDMVEIEGDYSLLASVQVSMDNAQTFQDCIAIPAVVRVKNGICMGDNIPYIIDYLCKNVTEDDFAVTIASNLVLDKLRSDKNISKRFERLSCYDASYMEDKIGFGRAGDYYTYISRIYKTDVKELLDRETVYDFSIVIPVRNVTETFFYTLQTCLEQDYEGSYEILVSDNSSENHCAAYDIVNRFSDKRIRYFKTPRNLNISKSFEFAYLQTQGRFIIPIGADDGIFPWALSVIKGVLDCDEHSEESKQIICWRKALYVWPGYSNGQEHKLVIPAYYSKDKVNSSLYSTDLYLHMIKEDPAYMFELPNMYMNSGFEKGYLKTLYEKTGSILDGSNQDVYMGLVNISINSHILLIDYPIVLGGASSASYGYFCSFQDVSSHIEDKKNLSRQMGERGVTFFVRGRKTYCTPALDGNDASMVYRVIENLVSKNIFPSGVVDNMEIEETKKRFLHCFRSVDILNENYFRYILEGYEIAKSFGQEFKTWYEEEILIHNKKLLFLDQKTIDMRKKEKSYQEGYCNKSGGIILDASRYNVTNICEAVQLFGDFLHF